MFLIVKIGAKRRSTYRRERDLKGRVKNRLRKVERDVCMWVSVICVKSGGRGRGLLKHFYISLYLKLTIKSRYNIISKENKNSLLLSSPYLVPLLFTDHPS